MAREFENRRSSRRSKKPNQFLVSTVTFLLGYLTASFCDIEMVAHWINNQVLAHQEITKAVKPDTSRTIPPKPKFEFYTLLTNEKTSTSQASTNSASATASANPNPAPTSTAPVINSANMAQAVVTQAPIVAKSEVKVQPQGGTNAGPVKAVPAPSMNRGNFLVQVASFKVRQDAEQMKGSLTLKGFSVYIIPVSHTIKGNWFRVVVGPYSNRGQAQQAQKMLANNERLHGMITSAG